MTSGGRKRREADAVVVPMRPRSARRPAKSRSGLEEARRYHPRGATVRETREYERQRDLEKLAKLARATKGTNGKSTPAKSTPAGTTPARSAPHRAAPKARARPAPAKRPAPARRSAPAPRRSPPRRRRARLGSPRRRIRFATVIVLGVFTVIALRLVQIQTLDGTAYAAESASQRTREQVLEAPRGAILDRDGNPLARSVQARAVFADPSQVRDPAGTAAKLAPLLKADEATLARKLAAKLTDDGRPRRFVYLARGQDPMVGERVDALGLAGIHLQDEERREVPGKTLAASVVGFTGRDGDGLGGLEASYDDVLSGTDGVHTYEVSGGGQQIPSGYDHTEPAKPGRDLQLTIDRDVQFRAEAVLADRMREVSGSSGSAVVLDARTGEILALASYPGFDVTDPTAVPATRRTNQATSAVVEPGSVHKAITIAAGLEEGVIRPDSVLTVPPTIRKGGVTYRDTHKHGTVKLTLTGVMAQSSNVATIEVADALGADRLYRYQRAFGLGSRTHTGLPGESAGLVQPPDAWSGSSHGSIPIGLGVAVTPLQMASVYQAIANDGVRVPPTLVAGTRGADGKVAPADRPQSERVLSAENARALRAMMEAVTSEQGTAHQAAIPGYRVAGKTGTGLRVLNDHYLPGNVSSFVGMVPADAPRYVVAVQVHAPSGLGGPVSGPAFRDLASFVLRHYRVPPTGQDPPPIRIYGDRPR